MCLTQHKKLYKDMILKVHHMVAKPVVLTPTQQKKTTISNQTANPSN